MTSKEIIESTVRAALGQSFSAYMFQPENASKLLAWFLGRDWWDDARDQKNYSDTRYRSFAGFMPKDIAVEVYDVAGRSALNLTVKANCYFEVDDFLFNYQATWSRDGFALDLVFIDRVTTQKEVPGYDQLPEDIPQLVLARLGH
jgi:hypothetical protein